MKPAAAILFHLARHGLGVTTVGQNLLIAPRSKLTPEHRALIAANKPALVELLTDAHETAEALVQAIKLACDHRGDDEANRLGLIEEYERLAPH